MFPNPQPHDSNAIGDASGAVGVCVLRLLRLCPRSYELAALPPTRSSFSRHETRPSPGETSRRVRSPGR